MFVGVAFTSKKRISKKFFLVLIEVFSNYQFKKTFENYKRKEAFAVKVISITTYQNKKEERIFVKILISLMYKQF